MKKITLIIVFTIVIALGVIITASQIYTKKVSEVKTQEIDIVGRVTSINGNSILVEFLREDKESTKYDKASVSIVKDTEITKVVNNEGKNAKKEDINLGDEVSIIFTGAVAESYPVQATAKEITIFKNKLFSEKELINRAYNYLDKSIQTEIINKYDAEIIYRNLQGDISIPAVKETNMIDIKDKEVLIIDFQREVKHIPNNTLVILDNNTKEVLGLGLID